MHYKCLIYWYTSSIQDYCHMTVKIVELNFLGLSDIEDLCQIHMAGIVAPTLPCIPMSGFCNFGDAIEHGIRRKTYSRWE
jgi:hypothetical protein